MYGLRHITKNPIRVTVALSVLIHLAALWKLPPFHIPLKPQVLPGGPLIVQLAPPPTPRVRAERIPQPPAPPPALAAPPRAAERPRPVPPPPPPPVIARAAPAPAPLPATPPRAAPSAPAPAPASDFASYVAARRLARGETEAPPATPLALAAAAPPSTAGEDPNARANRIAAANLGLDRKPTFGERRSGGVFEPTYMSGDYAEFVFYGWNKEIRRDTSQKIEVRKGANPDIRIAMVRRMIAIIREHEQEDFVWESLRLGRNVTLSARARDTAGLEDFLMREFFDDPRRPAALR